MLTPEERAAVTFDMFLTGLVRFEMIGHSPGGDGVGGSIARAISLVEGLLGEYTELDNSREDKLRIDIFKRVLTFLKGEDILSPPPPCERCKGTTIVKVLGGGGDYEDWPCPLCRHAEHAEASRQAYQGSGCDGDAD